MTLASLREECKTLVDRIHDEPSLRTFRDLLLLSPEEQKAFIVWAQKLEKTSPLYRPSLRDAALYLQERKR